ncbi:MAG: hypothetical protein V4561_06330 [Bacteroidota bacterium]
MKRPGVYLLLCCLCTMALVHSSIHLYGQDEQGRLPPKNRLADSMRKLGMRPDTTRALLYNERARPIDSVGQREHNDKQRGVKDSEMKTIPRKRR